MGEPDAVAVAAFGRAVAGKRGELDAWLEVHDEAEVRAMIVAYAGHAKVPEFGQWQPIETEPRDELILVGPTKRMGICAAMLHSRDGWVTETCSDWVSIYTPTHWMPLPPPPGAKEGE